MVEEKIPKSQVEVVKRLAKESWREQAEVFENQARKWLYFIIEQGKKASSWEWPEVKRVMAIEGATVVRGRDSDFITNSEWIVESMEGKKCRANLNKPDYSDACYGRLTKGSMRQMRRDGHSGGGATGTTAAMRKAMGDVPEVAGEEGEMIKQSGAQTSAAMMT